jgi:type I restriction enzyme S subunit
MNKKVAGASSSMDQHNREQDAPATPRLRFPEFRGTEGWKEIPLKAAALINPSNSSLPESFIYIDLESVEAGQLKAQNRITRERAPSRAQRLMEHGDIIYQVVRPYQRNNLLFEFDKDENYVASTGYAQLRAKGNNRFLYQSVHTDSFVSKVIKKCTGSSYPAINSSDLAEISLPIPPTLAEQQRIADCLSSLDALIAAQARKVDALKSHKKGLMQQLFPRDGETQPRLRFPEFQDAGEWDSTFLGDVATFVNEKISFERVAIENYISTENIMPNYGDVVKAAKLPTTGSVTRYRPNDTLFSNIRPYLKKVWVADKEGGSSNDVIVIRAKERLLPQYFSYLLKNDAFIDYVMTGAKGVKMPRGDVDSIKSYPTLYPSKAEQQRIADCLSSLDALISAATQRLAALKTHKQGLMQQLFPSMEEQNTL